MEIKVNLNESEIMQMVLRGATEEEIANQLKSRIVESAIYKLAPILSKQVAEIFKKEMKKENWKKVISSELKKKINSEVDKHIKGDYIERIVLDDVYDILESSLENKVIKITL